jgi:hypothetical protein
MNKKIYIGIGVVLAVVGVAYLYKKYKKTSMIGAESNPIETKEITTPATTTNVTAAPISQPASTAYNVKLSDIESILTGRIPSDGVSKIMTFANANNVVIRPSGDKYAGLKLAAFINAVIANDTTNGVFKHSAGIFKTPQALAAGLTISDAFNQKVITETEKTTWFNLIRGL